MTAWVLEVLEKSLNLLLALEFTFTFTFREDSELSSTAAVISFGPLFSPEITERLNRSL